MECEPSVEVGRMNPPGAEWSFCEPKQSRRRPAVTAQSSEGALGAVPNVGRRPLQLDALQAQADTIHRQLQQAPMRRSTAGPTTLKSASEVRTRYSLQSLPSVDLMSGAANKSALLTAPDLAPSPAPSAQTQHSWDSEYGELDLGEALHLSNVIRNGMTPEPTVSSTSTQDTTTTFFPATAAAGSTTPNSSNATSALVGHGAGGVDSTSPTSSFSQPATTSSLPIANQPAAASAVSFHTQPAAASALSLPTQPAPTSLTIGTDTTAPAAGHNPLSKQHSTDLNGPIPVQASVPAPLPTSAAALRSSITTTGGASLRTSQVLGRGRQAGSQSDWQEKMSAGLSELSQILKSSKGVRTSITSLPSTSAPVNAAAPGNNLVNSAVQPAASSASMASDQTAACCDLPGSPRQDSIDTGVILAQVPGSPMDMDQEADSWLGPATVDAMLPSTRPVMCVSGTELPKPTAKESNALQAAKMLRQSWVATSAAEPPAKKSGWASVAEPPSSPTLGSFSGDSAVLLQSTSQSQPSYTCKTEEAAENTASSRPPAGLAAGGGRERVASKNGDGGGDGVAPPAQVQQRRAAARAETERLVMETAMMFQFRGGGLGGMGDGGNKLDASTMTSGPGNLRAKGVRGSRVGLPRPTEPPPQDAPTTTVGHANANISKGLADGEVSTLAMCPPDRAAAVGGVSGFTDTAGAGSDRNEAVLAEEDVDMMELDEERGGDGGEDAAEHDRVQVSSSGGAAQPAAFMFPSKPPSGAAAMLRAGSSTPRQSFDLSDGSASQQPAAAALEPGQAVWRSLSLTNTHSSLSSSDSLRSIPSSTARSLGGIPSPQLLSSPHIVSPRRTSSDDGSSRIIPPPLGLKASISEAITSDAAKFSSSGAQDSGTPSVRRKIPSAVPGVRENGAAATSFATANPPTSDGDGKDGGMSPVGKLKSSKTAKAAAAVNASWTEGMSKRPVSASAASVARPMSASAPGVFPSSGGGKAAERGEIPRVRARKVWGEATPPPNLSLLPSPPSTPLTASMSQFCLTPRSETRSNGRISAPPSRSDTPSRLESLFSGGSGTGAADNSLAPLTRSRSLLRRSLSSTSDSSEKDLKLQRSGNTTPGSTPSTPTPTPGTLNLTANLILTSKKSGVAASPSQTAKTSKANQKPAATTKVSRSLSLGTKSLTTQSTDQLKSPITRSISGASSSSLANGTNTSKGPTASDTLKSPIARKLSGPPGSGTINANTPSSVSKSTNSLPTKTGATAPPARKNSGGNRGASSIIVEKQAQATITLGPGGRGPVHVDMQVREIPVPGSGLTSSVAKLRAGSANKLPVSKKDVAAGSDKPSLVRSSMTDAVPSQPAAKNPVAARNTIQRTSSLTNAAVAKADREQEAQKRRPAPRKAVASADSAPVTLEKLSSSTNGTLPKAGNTMAGTPAKRSASPAPSIKRAPSPTPSRRAVSPAFSVSSRISDISIMPSKEREGSVMDCMWLMLYDGMTVISRSAPLLAPKGRPRASGPKTPTPANIFAKWLGSSLLPMIPDSTRTEELLATEVPDVYRSKTGKKLATVEMIVNHLQDCWFGLKPVPNTTTARLSLSLRASFQPPTSSATACIRVVKNGKDCSADGSTSWLADYTVPGLMYMSGGQLQPPSAADVLANAKLLSAWTVD